MSTIDELLPSSSSDSDDDVEEEAHVAVVKEPKVASVLTSVPPVMVAVEDVKMEITPIVQPTVLKESIQKAFAESIWKPVIDKGGAAPKKKVSVDNAMEKERFLLMKSGQDQDADNLYKKRDLIKKHITNAEQIVFGEDNDISSVRSFIEERYRLHFGLGPDGHPRELSAEEKEEVDFLIENSTFITKVILRMHDLEPEDYKGKIENFHMQAKLTVFQEEKAIRDKELQDMNSERQRIFFQHKERSEQLSRARAGEESSDDDVDDDMEEGEDDLARRQTEIENELIKKMKEMKVEINPEQVAICVSDMIAAMSIHTTPYERVRASSPPRQEDKGKPLIDLPWSAENDTDDELLEETPEEVDLTEDAALRSVEGKNEILFDWSEDIFPDDDNTAVGEKRPLDVLDVLDFRPKRRAVEKNGNVEPKPMDTTPPPAHLRSCLKHHNEILTDINEDHLSVKERIKWRTAFETHAAKKKHVHFTDFDDPRNKCRFYIRPLDDGNISHRSDNLLKDVCKQATYVDCTLTHGRQIIYKNLRRQPAASASNSHDPEAFLKRLAKLRDSDKFVTKYSMEHPSQFLMLDIHEMKSANGLHLPAFPGKEAPQVPDMSNKYRAHTLSCFRMSMQHFIQNRAGITKVNHIDEAKNLVAGILILSDSLLRAVEQKKLSNAVIQRFHPSQCAEDILEVLDRCSYEELDIRHCMLAWGHDLIAYFQQSPILAAGQALASLIYIRATFQRKKQLFEQEGYRKRNLPIFWLLTIPEIGDFAQHFKIFNNLMRAVFNEHPDFRVLDWALDVERSRATEKRRSPYTKIAVEQRLKQLFDLCRNEMDLTYFRYSNQKNVERAVAYSKHDYDSGDFRWVLNAIVLPSHVLHFNGDVYTWLSTELVEICPLFTYGALLI